jgi:hypothetical protein
MWISLGNMKGGHRRERKTSEGQHSEAAASRHGGGRNVQSAQDQFALHSHPYTDSMPDGILVPAEAGAGMGSDESKRQASGKFNPVKPTDREDPYPSPIVVTKGGGSFVRLPVPERVVEGLGGPSQLRGRLNAILASEPYQSGEIDRHAAATLTTDYEKFFQRLETMSEYPTPIQVDPSGGWSVTIPIPRPVVEGLGGRSQLRERLASIRLAESSRGGQASPQAAAKLTAHCDELLGRIETIVSGPGH